MIEDKLKVAKEKYRQVLEERTLSGGEFLRTVFGFLKEQGIVTGEYDPNKNYEQTELNITIACRLNSSLGVQPYVGLDTIHFGLPGKRLTLESAHDVAKYEQVLFDVKKHFGKKDANTPILEEELKKEVKEYVVEHPLSHGLFIPNWLNIYFEIKKQFNVIARTQRNALDAIPGLEDALKNI